MSAYGFRDFFARIKDSVKGAFQKYGGHVKSALKDAAKKALEAGKEELKSKVMAIVENHFKDAAGSYAVDDEVKSLRKTYAEFGDDLCKLGKALEQEGYELSVGKKVSA